MSASVPIILEHSDDIPMVELRHILHSGSSYEPADTSGVGRLALRLIRRGAGELGRRALDEEIDRIATLISAQATADFYALHLRVLKKHLGRAVDIFSDILHRPKLDPLELDRLKRETIAEIISSRDDDRHLASRAMRGLLFGDHPYGRSSRGSLATVEAITIDDVQAFLDKHLSRNNLMVGAAGDVTEEELQGLVSRTVGRLPDTPSPSSGGLEAADKQSATKVILVDKPERTQTQIFIGQLGPSHTDPFDLPLRVALTAFGGTFTSTLMQEVRVKRGWSYGAYAGPGRARLPEALTLWAAPAMDTALDCLKLMIDLFADLHQKGPAAEDVEFARDYLARSLALQKDTASARLTLRLRQQILGLPEDYYDTFADRVRRVESIQATEAVEKLLTPQSLCIAITCTADKIRDPLRQMLGDDVTIETVPYSSPDL